MCIVSFDGYVSALMAMCVQSALVALCVQSALVAMCVLWSALVAMCVLWSALVAMCVLWSALVFPAYNQQLCVQLSAIVANWAARCSCQPFVSLACNGAVCMCIFSSGQP